MQLHDRAKGHQDRRRYIPHPNSELVVGVQRLAVLMPIEEQVSSTPPLDQSLGHVDPKTDQASPVVTPAVPNSNLADNPRQSRRRRGLSPEVHHTDAQRCELGMLEDCAMYKNWV